MTLLNVSGYRGCVIFLPVASRCMMSCVLHASWPYLICGLQFCEEVLQQPVCTSDAMNEGCVREAQKSQLF